jgi:hypothetical protein
MMKAETLIRRAPTLLVAVGMVDLAKQLAALYYVLHEYRDVSLNLMSQDARLQVQASEFERAMDVIIYPAGWLAYAAFAVILLGIYDRLKVDGGMKEAAE